ncbi:MAG: hypothetical protein LBJ15_12940 [Comamonas sp.]|uniref:hypothetical protein n=1 Tax=Comamonas sp. TaxID=34028 RepID=UPI002826FB8D|nr:hypothetical protein [Comamonas sp.]MDR0214900.1 hypothetical protein [Comamonas sp.]
MSNFWSRLGQFFLSAGAMNARQPLLAWEASWDEAEALIASGKLWPKPPQTQAGGRTQEASSSTVQAP